MAIHPKTRARQVMSSVGEPDAGPHKTITREEIKKIRAEGGIVYETVHWPEHTMLEQILATHRAHRQYRLEPNAADFEAAHRIADMLMKDVE